MPELSVRCLRTATLDLHAAAERHVRILDDDATLATYMHGVHAAIEAAFSNHAELAAPGFDARARCKSRLIRADLALPQLTSPPAGYLAAASGALA